MKLATRLALLFGVLASIFLGALTFLHAAQQRSAAKLRTEIADDKARQLTRLVALSGNTLERFAADYTQWDEMCAFVASHNPAWATINLEQSVASWGFHGIWVFDAERREIYRHQRAPFTAADLAAIPSAPPSRPVVRGRSAALLCHVPSRLGRSTHRPDPSLR